MATRRISDSKIDPLKGQRGYSRKLTILLASAFTFLSLTIAYAVTAWSLEFTSTDEFCVRCHEMGKAYAEWKASTHYKNKWGVVATCADCHLPTSFVHKVIAKGKYGMKETVVRAHQRLEGQADQGAKGLP